MDRLGGGEVRNGVGMNFGRGARGRYGFWESECPVRWTCPRVWVKCRGEWV